MRRELTGWLVVLVALSLLLGFAWLTWEPEHPVFERISGWAVIGPGVERLRQRYLQPEPVELVMEPATEQATEPDAPAVQAGLDTLAHDRSGRRDWVFLGIGAALREAPSRQAALVRKTVRLDQYRVLERDPPWVRVALRDGREAWVDLEAPRDRTPPLGSAPTPPGPLPARRAMPEALALADSLLVGPASERSAGGYRLRSDVADVALLDRLAERVAELETVYEQRYGVRPVGEPAETIVLFSLEESYRRFESRVPELRGLASTGHAIGGVGALFAGDRREREVLATAVHEVTHLLNRRALGPALPPWLEEGLADELSLLGLPRAGGGSPFAGTLEVDATTIRGSGPLAGLVQLLDRLEAGTLPSLESLVASDWQDFREDPRARELYSLSGFFIDYLLERESRSGLRSGFRSFLAAVARGGPASGERLIAAVGVSWTELEADFRSWLLELGEAAGAGLLRGRPSAEIAAPTPPPEPPLGAV